MLPRNYFLSIALFLIAGCFNATALWADGGNDQVDLNRKTSPDLVESGKKLFVHFCVHCHGLSGDGDGFNAEFLDKEPAQLSDHKFQSKKTDHQIFRVIQKGGAGVRKSHLMPVFGNTLSATEIWSLVAFIRSLGGNDSPAIFLPQGVETERPLGKSATGESIRSFRKWFQEAGEKKSSIQAGEKLFKKKKSCIACHQIDEEGGRVGPDLSRSRFRYRPEWLYAWILNPQAYRPETRMANLGVSVEEAQTLAAFLAGLPTESDEASRERLPYLKARGNAKNGKSLFFDPDGKVHCAKCHRADDKGGKLGPDLSYVGTSRSPEFLLESVLDPKAVITSGYATVLILTKDRKFITGIKKFEDGAGLNILDKEGKERFVRKADIKKFKTQKISMMPGNFQELLNVQEVADILAYLASLKLPEFSAVAEMEP